MTELETDARFKEQTKAWRNELRHLQKESTRRSNLSLFVGFLAGIAIAIAIYFILLALRVITEDSALPAFLSVFLVILTPLALYNLWAKRLRNRQIQAQVERIRQGCDAEGFSKAEVVRALVTRLPHNLACSYVADALDPVAAAAARKEALEMLKLKQAQAPVGPRFDESRYHQVEAVNERLELKCPGCRSAIQVGTSAFHAGSSPGEEVQVARSGGSIMVPTRWLNILISLVVALVSGVVSGNVLVSVVVGVILMGTSRAWERWLLKSFGREVPIWLVTCPKCQERLPVCRRDDNKQIFAIFEIQSTPEGGSTEPSAR